MMQTKAQYILILLSTVFCVAIITAQETCDAIVQQAIETASANCDGLRRNEACYGNVTIDAEAAPDVTDFTFDSAGDIANVSDIASLRLSSQVEDTGDWGIVPMELQMNLSEDTTANVQVVLFGDVELQIPSDDSNNNRTTIEAVSTGNLNVRGGPSTTDSVVGSLTNGQIITLDARNETSQWARFLQENGTVGWVFVDLLTIEGDITSLPLNSEVTTELTTPDFPSNSLGDVQSYYLRTGTEDSPCSLAPASGILIQTPEGVGRISFEINEVRVDLGSTMYITSSSNNELIFGLLEGHAIVSSADLGVGLSAGTQTRVPMDGVVASGSPSAPELIRQSQWSSEMLSLLARTIEFESLSNEDEILSINSVVADTYQIEWSINNGPECPTDNFTNFNNGAVAINTDGNTMTLESELAGLATSMTHFGSGVFRGFTTRTSIGDNRGVAIVLRARIFTAWIVDENRIEGSVKEIYVFLESNYQEWLDTEPWTIIDLAPELYMRPVNEDIAEALTCNFDNTFTLTRS